MDGPYGLLCSAESRKDGGALTGAQRDGEIARLEGEIVSLKAEIYDREVAIGHLRAVPVTDAAFENEVDEPQDPQIRLNPRDQAVEHVKALQRLGHQVTIS